MTSMTRASLVVFIATVTFMSWPPAVDACNCRVDCVKGTWGEWSACSCLGKRYRERVITTQLRAEGRRAGPSPNGTTPVPRCALLRLPLRLHRSNRFRRLLPNRYPPSRTATPPAEFPHHLWNSPPPIRPPRSRCPRSHPETYLTVQGAGRSGVGDIISLLAALFPG